MNICLHMANMTQTQQVHGYLEIYSILPVKNVLPLFFTFANICIELYYMLFEMPGTSMEIQYIEA